MTPCRKHFLVGFVLGEKAVGAAHGSSLPDSILSIIDDAPRCVEGRGVRVEVRTGKDLAGVVALAAVKMANWPSGGVTMATRRGKATRDVERSYPAGRFVAKLRRLADCIEKGDRFRIQIAGQRVSIPPHATISVEHERGSSAEEVEFQIKWPLE